MKEGLFGIELRNQVVATVDQGIKDMFRGSSVSASEIVVPHTFLADDERTRGVFKELNLSGLPMIFIPDAKQILHPSRALTVAVRELRPDQKRVSLLLDRLLSQGSEAIYLPLPEQSTDCPSVALVENDCYKGSDRIKSRDIKLGSDGDSEYVLLLASKAPEWSDRRYYDFNFSVSWFLSSISLPQNWQSVVRGDMLKEFTQKLDNPSRLEKEAAWTKWARNYAPKHAPKIKTPAKKLQARRQASITTVSEKKRSNGWQQR